jgi:single-stranded-DNA-specific exonuclease
VRHGLKLIKTTEYPGLKTFFPPEDRALPVIPSEKLSFNVGPLINSKGRLDHPEKALEVLIADDQDQANLAYNHLEISNRQRKMIQQEVFSEARELAIAKMSKQDQAVTIVYAPHWHEGVIGIVASKLVDTFRIPAVVFTNAETPGMIKASARSAGELNIFDCLNQLAPLYERFGGHKAAAGLSMKLENFAAFEQQLQANVNAIPVIIRTEQDYFDIEIKPEEISPDLLKQLELLEPFGMGNPKPVFRMNELKLESFDLLKDVHVRWSLMGKNGNRYKGISFNYIGRWGLLTPEEIFSQQQQKDVSLTAYFELAINRWNGREYIQLMVDRITT